jgi:hypothetical protein
MTPLPPPKSFTETKSLRIIIQKKKNFKNTNWDLNKNNIAIYEELEGTQLKQGKKKSES